ncbi:MAG: hypothetical protein IJY74_00185 [Oscillospiraceae bacterium]|nr:hypothetical protein [Oscillospiraceae bacterium]
MTAKQTAFLQAMLEKSTVTKAAASAGISRATAYKYLHDPAFQAELTKRRRECICDTVRFLQSRLTVCSEKLLEIVEKPDTADQVKINAINAVFANCKAMTETADVITRLERIEELIGDDLQ